MTEFKYVARVGDYAAGEACLVSAAIGHDREARGLPLGLSTDHDDRICLVARWLSIAINDFGWWDSDAERTLLLSPFEARLIGSADPAKLVVRANICADYAVRVFAPLARAAVGLAVEAAAVAADAARRQTDGTRWAGAEAAVVTADAARRAAEAAVVTADAAADAARWATEAADAAAVVTADAAADAARWATEAAVVTAVVTADAARWATEAAVVTADAAADAARWAADAARWATEAARWAAEAMRWSARRAVRAQVRQAALELLEKVLAA